MISNEHPDYQEHKEEWEQLRHAFKGQGEVKRERTKYLPALPSHLLDGMHTKNDIGWKNYDAYLMRAVFPDFMTVGVETLVGILNAQPAIIKLPAKMEYLRAKATNKGENMLALLRRLHTQQLITGRVGMVADLPTSPDPVNPQLYIALYASESIINWDEAIENIPTSLNLVVLNESMNKRHGTVWTLTPRYRVLQLGDMALNEQKGIYKFGVFENEKDEFNEAEMTVAAFRGNTLDEIPFVFINSKDNLAEPDVPPLLGLGDMCYTIYRAEADYRNALYMSGQDTLVVIGGVLDQNAVPGQAVRVGSGARIDVPIGGDAKYVGVSSTGLPEMRTSVENDKMAAAVRTGQLLAPGKMSMESGEALKTRVAAQTATLTSVAVSAAEGLKRLLQTMAKWVGENPDDVDVIPNLDFTNVQIQGQDIVQLITAKNLGWPLSYESLHAIAKARGLTNNTFDQEMALINADPDVLIKRATEMAMNLKGNNPLEAAGGPTKTPNNKGATQGNKQKN